MKTIFALTTALFTAATLSAQEGPRKAEAVILIKNPNAAAGEGAQKPGWIVDSNDTAIMFGQQSFQPSAIQKSDLDGIRLETINASRQAQQLYQSGELQKAADLFGQIAELFKGVAFIDGNFATEARYMQIECLRQLGQFDKLGELLGTRTGQTISKYLPTAYQKQHAINALWVLYANSDWSNLKERIKRFEIPPTGNESLLPAAKFVKLEASFLAQIAFFRAAIFESEGAKPQAIEDYYTAATSANGSNHFIASEALKRAVLLQSENPSLESNKPALWNIQSAAFVQSRVYAGGTAPAEIATFAVMPDKPKPTFAPKEKKEDEEKAEAPATDEEAPKEEAAAEKKKGKDKKKGE